ncbi:MAG: hypothetical protein AAF456_25420 [Planctomycetota bacterium]
MKKVICLAAVAVIFPLFSGCANGPVRNWLRGRPCNLCNPPVSLPGNCDTNIVNRCDSGTCGTGVCETGNCATPGQIPAGDFSQTPIIQGPVIQNPMNGFQQAPPILGEPQPVGPAIGPTSQFNWQLPTSDLYGGISQELPSPTR